MHLRGMRLNSSVSKDALRRILVTAFETSSVVMIASHHDSSWFYGQSRRAVGFFAAPSSVQQERPVTAIEVAVFPWLGSAPASVAHRQTLKASLHLA